MCAGRARCSQGRLEVTRSRAAKPGVSRASRSTPVCVLHRLGPSVRPLRGAEAKLTSVCSRLRITRDLPQGAASHLGISVLLYGCVNRRRFAKALATVQIEEPAPARQVSVG